MAGMCCDMAQDELVTTTALVQDKLVTTTALVQDKMSEAVAQGLISAEQVAGSILGERSWVRWPFLQEALVQAVSDRSQKVTPCPLPLAPWPQERKVTPCPWPLPLAPGPCPLP